MSKQTFPGLLESLPQIGAFIVRSAKKAGLKDEDIYAVELAVDEASTNIVEHGYKGKGGKIECCCEETSQGMVVVLKDTGLPFTPPDTLEPNFSVPLEDLRSGGAGVYLIRKLMDEVRFESQPNKGNILTMVKYRSR